MHKLRSTRKPIPMIRTAAILLGLTVGSVLTFQLLSTPASTQEAAAPADEGKQDTLPPKRASRKVKPAVAEPRRSVSAAPHDTLKICSLDRQAVLQNAEINRAAAKRLNELSQQAQVELNELQQSLMNDYRALNGAKLPPRDTEFTTRKAALDARAKALDAAADTKRRQIDLTRGEVGRQISVAALPVLQSVEEEKHCTLLLARESVLDGTGATDITSGVIEAMNMRLHAAPFSLAAIPNKGMTY